MEPYLQDRFGIPASPHQEGHEAKEAVKLARERFAALVNAEDVENILFTSNGTEAMNLAIKGAFFRNQKREQHVVLSEIEHPAVSKSVAFLESLGCTKTEVRVDAEGRVSPEEIREAIRENTILVAVHHSNHDLGTIQAIEAIGKIVAERGILFFVDATASAGWLPVDVQKWKASLAAFSPHRFYGPKGAGVLYRNRRARIAPLLHGGAQEDGKRAGTENVAAIVGAGFAAEIAAREQSSRARHVEELQKRTWSELSRQVGGIRLNGPSPGVDRHPGNLNLSAQGIEGESLALALDMRGIALASGAACTTKSLQVPPALKAIGLDESFARGNVLMTFGKDNTVAEVDYMVETFARTVAMLREMSPAWKENKDLSSPIPAPTKPI
jgi:cysteine desulfurase